MDGTLKSLANLSTMRDKFSVLEEMISEELKCLTPRQKINSKKLMYEALHMGALKKCNDEKYSNENEDGIVKIDVKDEKQKQLNMRKKPE